MPFALNSTPLKLDMTFKNYFDAINSLAKSVYAYDNLRPI